MSYCLCFSLLENVDDVTRNSYRFYCEFPGGCVSRFELLTILLFLLSSIVQSVLLGSLNLYNGMESHPACRVASITRAFSDYDRRLSISMALVIFIRACLTKQNLMIQSLKVAKKSVVVHE